MIPALFDLDDAVAATESSSEALWHAKACFQRVNPYWARTTEFMGWLWLFRWGEMRCENALMRKAVKEKR